MKKKFNTVNFFNFLLDKWENLLYNNQVLKIKNFEGGKFLCVLTWRKRVKSTENGTS